MILPDGPKGLLSFQLVRWIRQPLPFLRDCAERYGDIFTLRLAQMPPVVIIARPDAIKEVFSGDPELLHAGEANVPLRPFLGQHSLLQLDGTEHLRHRRLLLPPFHGERMHAYGAAMIRFAHDAVDAFPNDRPFALHGPMQEITMQVILRTVFGLEDGARFDEMRPLIRSSLEIAADPLLLMPIFQKDLGALNKWGRFQRISRKVDALLLQEIARRRNDPSTERTDVLSLLLSARDEAGKPLTDEELRDELLTLLVAGHETTATALAWAFRWLIATPHAMEKLRAELAALGKNPEPERIAKCEYLDAVTRETLRLQPVVPMVGRVLKKPMRIGDYDLPAGVVVAPSIYLASRRPEAFPNPERFEPERFLNAKPSPYEWFPFGGGVRRCIGMAFALYEMKMVLATMLARASLTFAPGEPIRIVRRSITLTPSKGLRVLLTRRDPRPARRTVAETREPERVRAEA